jgi:hypothetical protein
MTTTTAPRKLDKLDELIIHLFHTASPRGLTDEELQELGCEYIARSNDPELQRLADADPGFRAWRSVKVPKVDETH